MRRFRPACEIEPVRPISSSRRIFPGPTEPLEPKSTRNVNLVSLTMTAPLWRHNDTAALREAKAPSDHNHPSAASSYLKGYNESATASGACKAFVICPWQSAVRSVDADHHIARLDDRIGGLTRGEL